MRVTNLERYTLLGRFNNTIIDMVVNLLPDRPVIVDVLYNPNSDTIAIIDYYSAIDCKKHNKEESILIKIDIRDIENFVKEKIRVEDEYLSYECDEDDEDLFIKYFKQEVEEVIDDEARTQFEKHLLLLTIEVKHG